MVSFLRMTRDLRKFPQCPFNVILLQVIVGGYKVKEIPTSAFTVIIPDALSSMVSLCDFERGLGFLTKRAKIPQFPSDLMVWLVSKLVKYPTHLDFLGLVAVHWLCSFFENDVLN